jgi:hypothetical protein
MTSPSKTDETLADDLLRGCVAIADFIGTDPRSTFHYLKAGEIPATKLGRLWIGSRSRLRRHFSESTFVPAPKKAPTKRKPIRASVRRRASGVA